MPIHRDCLGDVDREEEPRRFSTTSSLTSGSSSWFLISNSKTTHQPTSSSMFSNGARTQHQHFRSASEGGVSTSVVDTKWNYSSTRRCWWPNGVDSGRQSAAAARQQRSSLVTCCDASKAFATNSSKADQESPRRRPSSSSSGSVSRARRVFCGSARNFDLDDDDDDGEDENDRYSQKYRRARRDDKSTDAAAPGTEYLHGRNYVGSSNSPSAVTPHSPAFHRQNQGDLFQRRADESLLIFPFSSVGGGAGSSNSTPTSTAKLTSKPPRPRGSTPLRPSDCVPMDRMNFSTPKTKKYDVQSAAAASNSTTSPSHSSSSHRKDSPHFFRHRATSWDNVAAAAHGFGLPHQQLQNSANGSLYVGGSTAAGGSMSSLLASPNVPKKNENITRTLGLGGRLFHYKVTSASSTSLPESGVAIVSAANSPTVMDVRGVSGSVTGFYTVQPVQQTYQQPATVSNQLVPFTPVSGASGSLDLEARVQKLEGDKNALQFQVSLLHDQIENQQQKIHDLERALESKRAQLMETEDALKRELNQRSSLEAHKLDLMTEIGNLHLKQSQLERENLELREQLRAAEITSLKFSVLPQAQPAAISFGSESGMSLNFDKLSLDGYLAGNSDLSSLPSSRPPAHSFSSSKGNPNSSSSAVASTSPLHYGFRGDQHQFLSLPRSAKHGRPKPIDSSDPSLRVALEQNLTTRPPSGAQRNSNPTGPTALSNNLGGPGNDVGSSTDWPLRDAPFRRPTTPTLDRSRERVVHSCSPSPSFGEPNAGKPRQKGIRNIFSKMKKGSSSTTTASDVNVISAPVISNDFHRGGIRATAGPRLGWSKAIPQGPEFSAPISSERPSKWSTENVCLWLGELGLGTYVPAARSWMQTGETLLSASPADLEKHLGVRNALHKKKILLGVERLRRLDRADPAAFSSPSGWAPWRDPGATSEGEPPAARLDSTSVLRWLTDVGLSQYREPFTECRVDGPVLDALTVEEATHWLKVTNSFHFLGLRNGIKVLREIEFDVSKLIRAANDDGSGARDENAGGMVSVSSEMLARWTNSRIIEWLRGIDLAEFADNLKGSGVHGGLLVYEDRFNAEALASVLAIPAGKTLLRRHLSLQFAALVGKSTLQAKREAEMNRQSTNPLSPATKIKVSKTQFGLIKRKNKFGEFEPEGLVCPLTSTNAVDDIALSSSMSTRTPSRENSVARGSSAPPSNVASALTSDDLPETMIE